MYLTRLLLTVFLPTLIDGWTEKPSHCLTFPLRMMGGDKGSCCLNLDNYQQPVEASAVMVHGFDSIVMMSDSIQNSNYYKCFFFDLPEVEKTTKMLVILTLVSQNVTIQVQKPVVIDKPVNGIMIFCNKPIYKPTDTVNMTIVVIDHYLKPMDMKVDKVYVTDPHGFNIAQWTNQVSHNGTIPISMPTDIDAMPGYYSIFMQRSTSKDPEYCGYFRVEEFVVPRIDVNLDAPQTVSVLETELLVKFSANYMSGDVAPGNVIIKVCRSPDYQPGPRRNCFDNSDICNEVTGEVGSDGTFTCTFDLNAMQIKKLGYQTSMLVTADYMEEGTETLVTRYHYIYFSRMLVNVQILSQFMDQYFKCGMDYYVKVLLTNEKGDPIPYENIELLLNDVAIKTLKTDYKGEAECYVDTTNYYKPVLKLEATYKNPDQCFYAEYSTDIFPTSHHWAYRLVSSSLCFVEIQRPHGDLLCGQSYSITVRYVLRKECVRDLASGHSFYFQVQNKQNPIHYSTHVVKDYKGSFNVSMSVTSNWAPNVDMLVKSFVCGAITAHTISVSTERCFANQVSMDFSQDIAMPGSDVDLLFSGAPNSMCGCRVYNKALRMLNPYEQFNEDAAYNFFYYWSQYGYYANGVNYEESAPPCKSPTEQIFCKDGYYVPVGNATDRDTYYYFKVVGQVVITNSQIRKPEICHSPDYPVYPGPYATDVMFSESAAVKRSGDAGTAAPESIETFRTTNVESFAFLAFSLNNEGHYKIPETLPGTLTEWMGDVFCLSQEKGFGMSKKPANVTTSLSFYVTLTSAPSCYMGEILRLTVSVSNNKEHYVKVQVSLHPSPEYIAVCDDDLQGEQCIPPMDKIYYKCNVSATRIGPINIIVTAETTFSGQSCNDQNDPSQPHHKDTVVHDVVALAAGIPDEITMTYLVCVNNSNEVINFAVSVPDNAVEGTVEASMNYMGDILCLACENINDLLLEPGGCCEQSAQRMATTATLLDHMTATQQLDEKRLQQGTTMLAQGLQRMMRCMNYNGAYGSFWGSNDYSSSWITIQSFYIMEKCKKYIYVPESIQRQTQVWLSSTQNASTGCFEVIGRCYSLREKTSPELAITAHAAQALLLSNYPLGESMLPKAMTCLLSAYSDGKLDMFLKAMLMYACALSKDWPTWEMLFEDIKAEIVEVGGLIYFHGDDDVGCIPRRDCDSIYVQTLACCLKAISLHPSISEDMKILCSKIALSMFHMMNSRGGSVSSTDTNSALEASTAYARMTFVPDPQHDMTLYEGSEEITRRSFNTTNRLLVQKDALPHVPGSYSCSVSGRGCMLIQATTKFNVKVPNKNTAFSVSVHTSSATCKFGTTKMFSLQANVSFHGNPSTCTMAMVVIRPISSYRPDHSSLQSLLQSGVISRQETWKGSLVLYIHDVSKMPLSILITYVSDTTVLKAAGGNLMCYCYYNKGQNGYATYPHPCENPE